MTDQTVNVNVLGDILAAMDQTPAPGTSSAPSYPTMPPAAVMETDLYSAGSSSSDEEGEPMEKVPQTPVARGGTSGPPKPSQGSVPALPPVARQGVEPTASSTTPSTSVSDKVRCPGPVITLTCLRI